MRRMRRRGLAVALVSALVVLATVAGGAADCAAKPPRALDASVSSEPDDIDRGVLGVRYAVGLDIRMKVHVIVMDVVRGGPAEQAGLRKGDRIVEINGEEVRSLPMKAVGPRMRGAPNTVLHLKVKRGINEQVEIKLIRGGLSQLPDKDFRSRMMARASEDEREARIRAVCHSLAATHPDMCKIIEAGKYEEAEAALERAVRVDRGNLDVSLLYALILDQNGKPDRAQEIVENLVAGRPKWAEAWQTLALCHEEHGNIPEAINALKKAVMLVTDKQEEASIRHRIGELMEQSHK